MTRRTFLLAAVFSLCAFAQEPIRYTVSFPAPHTHYLEVSASIPSQGPTIEVFMAVWTPGSYLVREYARNVEDFQASANGRPLDWTKSRKNRWLIQTGGARRVELRYKVYAHESSVQGNWVDAGFAMLNGAPNFVTPVGRQQGPYEVTLDLPNSWSRHISGMRLKPGSPNTYTAADFDELLDCPIYAGNGPIHEFDVEGKKHYLVNEGEGPMWDGPASTRDVAKIVAEYSRTWGGLPYDKYVFFNMLIESGGGLEHRNSTWLNASRWAYAGVESTPPGGADTSAPRVRRPSRQGWLGLVSHEYIHLWNVKRLRPVELGPFDFENENYTRSLWLAEGVTSYYGPLALGRAKLSTPAQVVSAMGGAIAQLQSTPGRLVQPVETASFDAWIKLYRPNENSGNTSISYYTKGQVIGFLLDAKIRKLTAGKKSLDDVMVLAYKRFGGARGFTPEDFRHTASEVAGADLSAWFRSVLETTSELEYSEALDYYGLRFRPAPNRKPVANGSTVNSSSGRILVTRVQRGTPAWNAGLNVDDEIIAVEDYRLRADQWPSRLDYYTSPDQPRTERAGNAPTTGQPRTQRADSAGAGTVRTIRLLISRRDKLTALNFPIVMDSPASWSLEIRSDATAEQKANLNAWLRQ